MLSAELTVRSTLDDPAVGADSIYLVFRAPALSYSARTRKPDLFLSIAGVSRTVCVERVDMV